MRSSLHSCARPFAAYLTAVILASLCWLEASAVLAGNAPTAMPLPPLPSQKPAPYKPSGTGLSNARPIYHLGRTDEIATLRAIHTALASVADGGAYVWQRRSSLLGGLIRPTSSFKSASGDICRHVIIRLNYRRYSRQVEGIACLDRHGGWVLSG